MYRVDEQGVHSCNSSNPCYTMFAGNSFLSYTMLSCKSSIYCYHGSLLQYNVQQQLQHVFQLHVIKALVTYHTIQCLAVTQVCPYIQYLAATCQLQVIRSLLICSTMFGGNSFYIVLCTMYKIQCFVHIKRTIND